MRRAGWVSLCSTKGPLASTGQQTVPAGYRITSVEPQAHTARAEPGAEFSQDVQLIDKHTEFEKRLASDYLPSFVSLERGRTEDTWLNCVVPRDCNAHM